MRPKILFVVNGEKRSRLIILSQLKNLPSPKQLPSLARNESLLLDEEPPPQYPTVTSRVAMTMQRVFDALGRKYENVQR